LGKDSSGEITLPQIEARDNRTRHQTRKQIAPPSGIVLSSQPLEWARSVSTDRTMRSVAGHFCPSGLRFLYQRFSSLVCNVSLSVPRPAEQVSQSLVNTLERMCIATQAAQLCQTALWPSGWRICCTTIMKIADQIVTRCTLPVDHQS